MTKLLPIGLSALLTDLATCLNWYRLSSPGLYCCVHATLDLPSGETLMPGVLLMVNHGRHRTATPEPEFERFRGAPNFIADVYSSTGSAQYIERRSLFFEAGVREYLAVFDTAPLTWQWNVLGDAGYTLLRPDDDGILRSFAMPGLWFPEAAMADRDWWTLMSTITRGVSRRGHHEFMDSIWNADQDE